MTAALFIQLSHTTGLVFRQEHDFHSFLSEEMKFTPDRFEQRTFKLWAIPQSRARRAVSARTAAAPTESRRQRRWRRRGYGATCRPSGQTRHSAPLRRSPRAGSAARPRTTGAPRGAATGTGRSVVCLLFRIYVQKVCFSCKRPPDECMTEYCSCKCS